MNLLKLNAKFMCLHTFSFWPGRPAALLNLKAAALGLFLPRRLSPAAQWVGLDPLSHDVCCCCCLVTKSCLTLQPDRLQHIRLPCPHHLPEFAQTHIHWVGDAIQPSYPLSPPSPPAFNLSQHQGLFQWVSSSHQVAKVLGLQLQHQSFQWIFRVDFL